MEPAPASNISITASFAPPPELTPSSTSDATAVVPDQTTSKSGEKRTSSTSSKAQKKMRTGSTDTASTLAPVQIDLLPIVVEKYVSFRGRYDATPTAMVWDRSRALDVFGDGTPASFDDCILYWDTYGPPEFSPLPPDGDYEKAFEYYNHRCRCAAHGTKCPFRPTYSGYRLTRKPVGTEVPRRPPTGTGSDVAIVPGPPIKPFVGSTNLIGSTPVRKDTPHPNGRNECPQPTPANSQVAQDVQVIDLTHD